MRYVGLRALMIRLQMLEIRLKVLGIILGEAEVITQGLDLSLLALVFGNRYYLLVQDSRDYEKTFTLGENFPLARFATRRIGKNAVQLVEQIFHLTPTLTLCHFMADT